MNGLTGRWTVGCMYVMYVCVYICMYVCMYGWMDVCMDGWVDVRTGGNKYGCNVRRMDE
jgi:hypothetical protein